MKQAKGCGNDSCVANKKKITYKEDDKFCPKCGLDLVVVCKKCRIPLPVGTTDAYCVRCEADREDRKDKAVDTVKKVGSAALAVGTFAISIASGGKIGKKS